MMSLLADLVRAEGPSSLSYRDAVMQRAAFYEVVFVKLNKGGA
jgi:hypothetical protein